MVSKRPQNTAAPLVPENPTLPKLRTAAAAQALLGRQFKVSTQRGVWVESRLAPFVMATVHPSSLLRAPDDEARHRETERFIADLKHVHEVLDKHKVV